MDDKTQELLRAMTRVRIENAIRQRVMVDCLNDITAIRNARGMTPHRVRKVLCLDDVSPRALGNGLMPAQYWARIRPNFNMLATIGYAVDETIAMVEKEGVSLVDDDQHDVPTVY